MIKWAQLKSNLRARGQVQATFKIAFYSIGALVKSIHVWMGLESLPHEWNYEAAMFVNITHPNMVYNIFFKYLYWDAVSGYLLITAPIETRSQIFTASCAFEFALIF